MAIINDIPAHAPVWLFIINTAAACYMTGLIWFVQIVHYPLFAKVHTNAFPSYQYAHGRRTTPVVAPVMLLELATAVLLIPYAPTWLPRSLAIILAALVALIWIATFTLQVPAHQILLKRGFSTQRHRSLLAGNWIRTAAWSIRAALCLTILALQLTTPLST